MYQQGKRYMQPTGYALENNLIALIIALEDLNHFHLISIDFIYVYQNV